MSLALRTLAPLVLVLGLVVTLDAEDSEIAELRRAAEQGDADAQHQLGVMYENGEGVAKDDSNAVEWHIRAAAQGHSDAQRNLAFRYETGKGVPQDYVAAYTLLLLASIFNEAHPREIDGVVLSAIGRIYPKMTREQINEAMRRAKEWQAGPGSDPQ